MSVQILHYNQETRSYEAVEGALERILLAEDVRDRQVVIISIGGAFRKGKSFLLNFFIRYLQDEYVETTDTGNWLGEEGGALVGFDWRGGSVRVTTGIHMWNRVFLHDYSDGRKVAIIVIDTQGTFDSRSTMQDCATMFGLSTLLSSVQIFNLMNNIQEDDLQHLQLFSEYGRLVANEGDSPFQKLLLLVRDWNYPYELPYGAEGGQRLLDRTFAVHEDQSDEHRLLRSHVTTCFNQISCFLMPPPGDAVTSSESFNGQLSEIRREFRDNLLLLVPQLFAPENLVVKTIQGQPVTASEFVDYFNSYLGIFQSGSLPEAKTIFQATADVRNMKAVEEGKNYYTKKMSTFCSKFVQIKEDELKEEHTKTKVDAISFMKTMQLMGTEEYLQIFIEKLDNLIEAKLLEFIEVNRGKLSVTKIVIGFLVFCGFGAAAVGGVTMAAPLLMEVVPAVGLPIFAFLLKIITRLRQPQTAKS